MRRRLPQALAAGLVLVTATGCSYKDFPRLGMPSPATEQAPRILSLWQGSWAAALAVGVLVWGLILWSAFFHRRSRTKVEVPPQTRYNMPIEALYTVVPLIIIAVLFYFTARDESKLLEVSKKPQHVINVVGYQWSWAFNYLEDVPGSPASKTAVPAELSSIPASALQGMPAHAGGVYEAGTPGEWAKGNPSPGPTLWLPQGQTVKFILTSRDVIHSFWVIPFLMKMDVIPGHTNQFQVTLQVTITAKVAEETAFLVEVHQAGIFHLGGFTNEAEVQGVLAAYCPNVLLPFAREAVANLVSRTGYPPVMLQPWRPL